MSEELLMRALRELEASKLEAHTGERREPDSRHRDTELCAGVSED